MAVASRRNRVLSVSSLPHDGLCRRGCVPGISIRARLAKRDSQTAMGTSRPLLLQITRGRAVILKDCLLQIQDVFNLSDARASLLPSLRATIREHPYPCVSLQQMTNVISYREIACTYIQAFASKLENHFSES